jgi:hypothetical protein
LKAQNAIIYRKSYGQLMRRVSLENLTIKNIENDQDSYSFDSTLKGQFSGIHLSGDLATALTIHKESNGYRGTLQIKSKSMDLKIPDTLIVDDQSVAAQLVFHYSDGKTEVKDALLDIGPQKFSLSAVQKNTGALSLDLSTESLNLEYLKTILPILRTLPPATKVTLEAYYSKAASKNIAPSLSGSLTAEGIKLPHFDFKAVSLAFAYHDPLLQIRNFRGQVLGGSFAGDAEMDLTPKISLFKFAFNLEDIAIENVTSLKSFASGRGDLTLKATGKGFEEDWTQTLEGEGLLTIKKLEQTSLQLLGPVFSATAWDLVKEVPDALNTETLQKLKQSDSQINNVLCSFKLLGGAVQIPSITYKFPNALASFSGEIGLDKNIRLEGILKIDSPLIDSLVHNPKLNKVLVGGDNSLQVPIQIRGTPDKPVVIPDNEFIQKRIQTFLKERAIEMTRETIQDSLKKKT